MMARVVAVVLAVAGLAVSMSSSRGPAASVLKRADDANNIAAFEALLQQQAATINDLTARLDAQDRKNQELTAAIQSLQASLSSQQNTIDTIQASPDSNRQTVGFHVDFGQEPYGYVNITSGASVLFNRVLSNIGGGYNQATGMFTTPVSGLYLFSLHFMGGNHDGQTDLAVHCDDGRDLCMANAAGSDERQNDEDSCTTVAQLDQGRGVSVKVHDGEPSLWGSTLTSFSGVLVHSD